MDSDTLPHLRTIRSICGFEPNAQDEGPECHVVGHAYWQTQATVTAITRRTDNYGDHGLAWFDVWCGPLLVASMQARAVASIDYVKEENENAG